MSCNSVLRISGKHYEELKARLFPGDGKEAAAIIFCRNAGLKRDALLVVDLAPIPINECTVRTDIRLTWPGSALEIAQSRAEDEELNLILIHSHPGDFKGFSIIDDESDQNVIRGIYDGWLGNGTAPKCGTAVMTPDGFILARLYNSKFQPAYLNVVQVQGDEIIHFHYKHAKAGKAHCAVMAFSEELDKFVPHIRAAVVGVSGTGSIVAEQLARMGFGRLTLIDFDTIEHKNLNRIVNSTLNDATSAAKKVDIFASAVKKYAPQIKVDTICESIFSRHAVYAVAECDVIFCCVDSQGGRQICDLIAQAFILPLIDIGVSLPTRHDEEGTTHIADVLARVDYVQPGGASLEDRGVYSPEGLRAEYLARVAPNEFSNELNAGYIKGIAAEAPPVISINMRAASAAVLEFIARISPFRHAPNANYSRTLFRMAEGEEELVAEEKFETKSSPVFGRGAAVPLLMIPALEEAP